MQLSLECPDTWQDVHPWFSLDDLPDTHAFQGVTLLFACLLVPF